MAQGKQVSKEIEIVRQSELLSGLTREDCDRFLDALHHKTVPAAFNLLSSEQNSSVVYFVISGTIKIYSEDKRLDQVILRIVGAGEVIGELNAIDGLGHSADATTLETCDLFWMDRDIFVEFLKTLPLLSYNLLSILSRRLRISTTRIQTLAGLDVNGRIAHQLLSFGKEYGQPGKDGGIFIPLRLTQSDLADLIGASRVRVNQVLTAFKKSRYLTITSDHHFTLLNPDALLRCCQ